MKIIEKNILNITEGVICHQVNCKGVFNAGLAKQIREKYPIVFQRYMQKKREDGCEGWKLGNVQIVPIGSLPVLFFVNIAGQENYGNDGKLYTVYHSLAGGLHTLSLNKNIDFHNVYFPYGMGCGLGGGDWAVVSELIRKYFPEAIFCRLPS